MNEIIVKRLANLLSVKSLVTLALTIVFSVMTVRQQISQDFMTVYAVVIAFYFGTQSQKVQDVLEGGSGSSGVEKSVEKVENTGGGNGNG